jgi:hypothetical protein
MPERNDPVMIGDGTLATVGKRVHHIQDWRIRTGIVIETIPDWCGARRMFHNSCTHTTDRVWVTVDRLRVQWIDWGGCATSMVDAENIVSALHGETFTRVNPRLHPAEFSEVKHLVMKRKALRLDHRFRTVSYPPNGDIDIRVKQCVVVDSLQRLAQNRDVFRWEDRDRAQEGDVLELEEGGTRFLLAVVLIEGAGDALRPDDV